MKTLLIFSALICASTCYGQSTDTVQAAPGWLVDIVAKYPTLATVVFVIGALRTVLKPVVALLHSLANSTATPKDNALLAKLESSKALRGILFVIDWAASIKVRK